MRVKGVRVNFRAAAMAAAAAILDGTPTFKYTVLDCPSDRVQREIPRDFSNTGRDTLACSGKPMTVS